MADYRAYTIGSDGHFIDYQGFACDNDADATEWARQLTDGHDIELWSGGRFVIRLNASRSNAASVGGLFHDSRSPILWCGG